MGTLLGLDLISNRTDLRMEDGNTFQPLRSISTDLVRLDDSRSLIYFVKDKGFVFRSGQARKKDNRRKHGKRSELW